MGLLAMAKAMLKAKTFTTSAHNNVTGLLLVFFPQDNSAIADKTKLFSSPSASSPSSSSSFSSSKSPTSSFRRTNSNVLLSKAQSTISICALLLFITLLLFTLSTFEPTISITSTTLPHTTHRRFLLQSPPPTVHVSKASAAKSKTHHWLPKLWRNKSHNASKGEFFPSTALQRMGTLYRRGTRAMSDLVVGHVAEDTTDDELRLFLRVIHRSGLTARADIVFIFASASLSSRFAAIIREENNALFSLIELHSELRSTRWSQDPELNFDLTRFFFKVGKKGAEIGEPLWGKRIRSNFSNPESRESKLPNGVTVLSYGSVLSFDATELDPENSLAGFLDRFPLSLRRWACYPMLLGRVRRNFKHIMLVAVKNLVVMNDPLGRVRNRSPESVFLFAKPESGGSGAKHSKKNSDKTQSQRPVNSAVVMGGARGIRRLSNAMLIEIVRAAMQHKRKNSVSESAVLSQLVGSELMLKTKNIDLITSTESIPDASSLGGRNSAASQSLSIIQRGTSSNNDLQSLIKKQICSSVVDSSVYRDC